MTTKLVADSWLLIRPSGTEPVLPIYAEGRSPGEVQELQVTQGLGKSASDQACQASR